MISFSPVAWGLPTIIVMLVIAAGGTLAWGVWSFRARRYRAGFRIPARRDDQCVCRDEHRRIPVLVEPDGFELPSGEFSAKQTVFLAVVVSATVTGHMLDPFIEIEHGLARYRQWFERGANGNRFLNLSLAFQKTPTSLSQWITLRGRHIRWKGEATLIVFNAPAIRGGETMVVSPHPDDSEIAAFGWYSQYPSWVVTVTAGERS